MPVHLEELATEITVVGEDLPLTEQQVESLVQRVVKRLGELEREKKAVHEATALRDGAQPPSGIAE